MNPSGLTVTADKILVQLLKVEEKTSGGIVLPGLTQDKEQMAQQIGTLIDWGSTAAAADELEGIKLGDVVLFHRYAGQHFPVDGVDYWIMKASQILGKCEKLPDYVLGSAQSTMSLFGANIPEPA